MTQHNPLLVDPVIHVRLRPLFDALVGVLASSLVLHDCYSRMLTRKDERGLPRSEEWPNKAASVGIDFHAEPRWTVIMREWMSVYRDWCNAIALATTAFTTPEVVAMLNAGESRVSKRWTVKANRDLAALAATMHPVRVGGIDGLGFIRNGLPPLPAAFEEQVAKIAKHRDTVRAVDAAAETAIKPRRKRKAPLVKQQRSLTAKESLAMATVARLGGNISAAAAELGLDRKTVRQSAARARKKVGTGKRMSRSVGARARLPEERPRTKQD